VMSVNERAPGSRQGRGEASTGLAELLFVGQAGPPSAQLLLDVAGRIVLHGDRVGLTVAGVSRGVQTVAASDDVAQLIAALQTKAEEGPCLEVVERNDVVHVDDLEHERQWPVFARQALDLGVRSLICVRSVLQPRAQVALTVYADQADAFSPVDVEAATILGSYAGLALDSERQRDRAANLEIALESNRHIGTAIGILMAREMLTAEQAFHRLRDVSQRRHRKLRDVAEEVARVGELAQDV
jgi:GAF domain-containing protein